jgi:hypothetical protein
MERNRQMGSPSSIRCTCGNYIFVLRVGKCSKCGEIYASHRASKEEIEEVIARGKSSKDTDEAER